MLQRNTVGRALAGLVVGFLLLSGLTTALAEIGPSGGVPRTVVRTDRVNQGSVEVTGNVTAAAFHGSGSALSGLPTTASVAALSAATSALSSALSTAQSSILTLSAAAAIAATAPPAVSALQTDATTSGAAIAGLVPYSGASQSVNLGAHSITAASFSGDGSGLTGIAGGSGASIVYSSTQPWTFNGVDGTYPITPSHVGSLSFSAGDVATGTRIEAMCMGFANKGSSSWNITGTIALVGPSSSITLTGAGAFGATNYYLNQSSPLFDAVASNRDGVNGFYIRSGVTPFQYSDAATRLYASGGVSGGPHWLPFDFTDAIEFTFGFTSGNATATSTYSMDVIIIEKIDP